MDVVQDDQLDILCMPKFIELKNDGVRSTYLRIDIFPISA